MRQSTAKLPDTIGSIIGSYEWKANGSTLGDSFGSNGRKGFGSMWRKESGSTCGFRFGPSLGPESCPYYDMLNAMKMPKNE